MSEMIVAPLPLNEIRPGDVLHAGILSNGLVMTCLVVDVVQVGDRWALHILNGRYAPALDGQVEGFVSSHVYGNLRGEDQYRTILDNGLEVDE